MGGMINQVVSYTPWGDDPAASTEHGGNVAYMPESGIIRVSVFFPSGDATATPLFPSMVMHPDIAAVQAGGDLTTIHDFDNKNTWFNWWRKAAIGAATADEPIYGICLETPESQTGEAVVSVCVHGVVQANCSAAVAEGDLLTVSTGSDPELVPAVAVANTPVLVVARALEDAVAAEAATGELLRPTWVEFQGLYGFGFATPT